jgi:hypothetical protein
MRNRSQNIRLKMQEMCMEKTGAKPSALTMFSEPIPSLRFKAPWHTVQLP